MESEILQPRYQVWMEITYKKVFLNMVYSSETMIKLLKLENSINTKNI